MICVPYKEIIEEMIGSKCQQGISNTGRLVFSTKRVTETFDAIVCCSVWTQQESACCQLRLGRRVKQRLVYPAGQGRSMAIATSCNSRKH